MIVLVMLACFGALPFGVWLGWHARDRYHATRSALPAFLVDVDASPNN